MSRPIQDPEILETRLLLFGYADNRVLFLFRCCCCGVLLCVPPRITRRGCAFRMACAKRSRLSCGAITAGVEVLPRFSCAIAGHILGGRLCGRPAGDICLGLRSLEGCSWFLGCPSHFWPNTSPASALAIPALSPMRFKPSNSTLALLLRFVLSACCLACFVLCTLYFLLFGCFIFGYPCRSSGLCARTTVEILVNPSAWWRLRLAGSLLMIYCFTAPTYKVS